MTNDTRPTEQASESIPEALRNELDWCVENGNVGPRTANLLLKLQAAIRALSTTPAEPVQTPDELNDALQDMQFVRGLQTGYSMGQLNDEVGYKAAMKSRDGYVSVIKNSTPDCATTPSAQEAQSAITVPDGWKLVPIDATPEMIDAVMRSGMYHADDMTAVRNVIADEYRTAIAASPTQSMKDK